MKTIKNLIFEWVRCLPPSGFLYLFLFAYARLDVVRLEVLRY